MRFGAEGVGEGLGGGQVGGLGLRGIERRVREVEEEGGDEGEEKISFDAVERERRRTERTPRTASVNKLIGSLFCFKTTAYGSAIFSFKLSLKCSNAF